MHKNNNNITLSVQIKGAYEILYITLQNILKYLDKILILTTIKSEYPRDIQIQIENKIEKIGTNLARQNKLKNEITKRIERLKETARKLKIRCSKRRRNVIIK